tara:strand:- start:561 stop:785 length:225 start_codon:yes stop_codon:yes gene_type:complete
MVKMNVDLHGIEKNEYIELDYNGKKRIAVTNYFGPDESEDSEHEGPRDYVNCHTPDGMRTFKRDKIENLKRFAK